MTENKAMGEMTDKDLAIAAANSVVYRGEMVDPPSGISVPRWRAMVDFVIRNGGKCLHRENKVVR